MLSLCFGDSDLNETLNGQSKIRSKSEVLTKDYSYVSSFDGTGIETMIPQVIKDRPEK